MSPVAFEVAQLFDGFPEPVLILREREVRYRNPAAERLFPALRDRATLPEDLSALLPECEAPAVVTARIGGGNYQVAQSRCQCPGMCAKCRFSEDDETKKEM